MRKKRYVILRKQYAGYMVNPLKVISKNKSLFIDGRDVEIIRKKKTIIVDDVISSGRTIFNAKKLIEKVGGKLIGVAVVIKQGEQQFSFDLPLFHLTTLPLFKK